MKPYTLDELSPNSPEHSAWLDGFELGMVVGAAIVAWGEAIRENFPEDVMPPCRSCGRFLFAGGFCCYRSALSAYGQALGERDHARKMQGMTDRRTHGERQRLRHEISEVHSLLRRLEWSVNVGLGNECPCCKWSERHGHEACELDAVLRAAGVVR